MPSKADRIATIIDTISSEDFGEVADRLSELAATINAAEDLIDRITDESGSALVSHESREWDARDSELSSVYDNIERLAAGVLSMRAEVSEVLDALESLTGVGSPGNSIIARVSKNIISVQKEIDSLV